ncbi:actin-related protein [Pseudovirgaria hyperparasitica]|uniref:Actin-related protein n=1 Tax=Pseudovirgaria hyperparasitica TaxID=470096 RepID=A0A6A6WG09_9PEZI|nr:actin-related protein [Pseudovirgaria hyperparasitica]KAF2761139.1 actin-related protein [Pseudovirgaria hyperparasitica]
MVGKKSGKAMMREEGLAKTDNGLDLSTWPQVNMINQKNYYTEYLKRDDQYLAYRTQNEDSRARHLQTARENKDRGALAQTGDMVDTTELADDINDMESGALGSQDVLGSKLVVIHVGSQNLRVGLGNDALPKTVPMVIARQWKENESEEGDGEPAPKRIKIDGEIPEKMDKWFGEDFKKEFASMSADLKTQMRNNKRRLLPNSKELVLNFNKRHEPDVITEHNDPHRIEWTEIPSKQPPEYITGEAALRIPEGSKPRYKLFWPIRNGCFNEVDYANKNLLYNDFTTILEESINNLLGLSHRKDWAQYSCVFIIPDLYERTYVQTVLSILIRDLGFGRVCFQQESLSATFGAGYSISCIVDIGHQKTSICCVDEGLCAEDSRINMKYGGADVTETFVRMMLHDQFPYRDINLRRRYDFLLAEELKRKFCTMQEQDITVHGWEFHLRAFGQDTRKYEFRTYDEVMLAPLGFFRPTIFDHTKKLECRRKLIDRSYDLYDGSPNDPLSPAQATVIQFAAEKYSNMTENGTQSTTETSAAAAVTSTPSRQAHFSLLSRLNEVENTPRSSIAGSPAPEGTPQQAGASSAVDATNDATDAGKIFFDPTLEKIRAAEERDKTLPVMPLDMAIIASITQGARGDERKMRDFFGGIMLIGGGGAMPGFGTVLEDRLRALKPGFQKEILIGPPPRELDPQVVVWKGGSVFGKLSPNGNDSWITMKEYDTLGHRLLVHKCMFPW